MEMKFSNEANKIWKELMQGVNVKPKHKNPSAVKTKKLLNRVKFIAGKSLEPTKVEFGTSGWRGLVGVSHTVQNFIRVTEGVVTLVKTANKTLLKEIGIKDFKDFKNRGVIVGRDNRIMGEKFAWAVMSVLQRHKVKVYDAGEAPTPEYSAAVIQLNAAMSINITPSHNPGCYAGYKINPADGGPAGEKITSSLEKESNKNMSKTYKPAKLNKKNVIKIDTTKIYKKQLKETIPHILNIKDIKDFIKSAKISLAIDHVHGSTRGRPYKLLNLTKKNKNVKIFHDEDNVLFHGIKPEPNEKNMRPMEKWLKKQKTKYKLGVLLDPDGDRIRFTCGNTQIDMNNFGPIAFHFLVTKKDIGGGVAKTVATSNFINSVASGLNRPVYETEVGFKYFRPHLKPGSKKGVVCAFEESDGFSIGYANILEKDAFGALMIALEIIRITEKNLDVYLKQLKKEYGIFEAIKSSISVNPELSKKKKLEKVANIGKKFKEKQTIKLSSTIKKKIKKLYPDDGIKIEFSDNSNLLIRPSGTEPIIKVYSESPVNNKDSMAIKDFGLNLVEKEFK